MIFKVVKKRRRKYNNVGLVILRRFMKKGIYTSTIPSFCTGYHPFITCQNQVFVSSRQGRAFKP